MTDAIDPIEEDKPSPAPWAYRRVPTSEGGWRDWIEDNDGNTVINDVGHIDGPRIVRAVNAMATKDGILS
jgi:hypothetical protein